MNTAIGICLSVMIGLLAYMGYVFCYTLNETALGGHLPFLLIVGSPAMAYLLGALERDL